MIRNLIISVIAMTMFVGCTKDQVQVSGELLREMGPGALIFIVPAIPFGIYENLKQGELEGRPHCTIRYCNQTACGSIRATIIAEGQLDVDLDEILKDAIPEKTHHNCPVEN